VTASQTHKYLKNKQNWICSEEIAMSFSASIIPGLTNFQELPAFRKSYALRGHQSSKAQHNATSSIGAKASH
jgi:hypothetical protein